MPKRMMVPVLLATALLSLGTSARAASISIFRLINVSYQSGSTTVYAVGLAAEDLVGNSQPFFFGSVYVATQSGADYGTGVLDVTLDPVSNAGRLNGTVQGNSGPLSVDIAFVGSTINSQMPPFVYIDVSPVPLITIQLVTQRFGHGVGSASSSFGSVNVPNANAVAAHGMGVVAP